MKTSLVGLGAALCALAAGSCSDSGLGPGRSKPAVSIVSPAPWARVFGTVTVEAVPRRGATVTGVRFLLNNEYLGPEDTDPPFESSLDTTTLPNEVYWLTAEASDESGQHTRSAAVIVRVDNTGTIRVGVDVPIGYPGYDEISVLVDGLARGLVLAAAGVTEISGISVGRRKVDLALLPYNCTAVPWIPPQVDVVVDAIAHVDFEVQCVNLPNDVIAFSGRPVIADSEQISAYDVFRSNLDGSGVVNLTNTPDYDGEPDWSPDGTQIAYVRGYPGQIFLTSADGAETRLLPTSPGRKSLPKWSPDGKKLVFGLDYLPDHWCLPVCYSHRLFVINVDGTGERQITFGESYFEDLPGDWSPDGTRIVFHRNHGPGAPSTGLYLIEPDALAPAPVWLHAGGHPSWSSDDRIVYGGADEELEGPYGTGINVIDSGGNSIGQQCPAETGACAVGYGPEWTADGEWIVFIDNGQVAIMRSDGFGRFRTLSGYQVSGIALSGQAAP